MAPRKSSEKGLGASLVGVRKFRDMPLSECTQRGLADARFKVRPYERRMWRLNLAASSTTQCSRARRVIHRIVYRCSPRRPPLIMCTGGSERHPPYSVPVLTTPSTAQRTGARHDIHSSRCAASLGPSTRRGVLVYSAVASLNNALCPNVVTSDTWRLLKVH